MNIIDKGPDKNKKICSSLNYKTTFCLEYKPSKISKHFFLTFFNIKNIIYISLLVSYNVLCGTCYSANIKHPRIVIIFNDHFTYEIIFYNKLVL